MMSILDDYDLFACGILVALLMVIVGIIWERRVKQTTRPSIATHSEQETNRENEDCKSTNDLSERSAPRDMPVNARLAKTLLLYTAEKIASASPSIFKLCMRSRKTKCMIERQSIGNPCRITPGRNERVLLVVGATGAGKTTLINGMVNYILGVEWKDDFRFKLITEEDKLSQAHSKTQGITAYTFYPMEGSVVPYTFTIIDTPGFGATEGLKRDQQITEQIKELFSTPPPDGIDHLDGIGFVVQASQARLTQTQKYIIDSILSIFGYDVSRNIFMMITFADGQRPPVLDSIKEADIPNHNEKHFKFNNSAIFAENRESEMCFDQMFWKMGFCSFQDFFVNFKNVESVSLRLTKEVLRERERLCVLVEGLNFQITMGMNKLEEMRQEENVLQQRESEIATSRNFTYTVDVTKDVREDLSGTGRYTTTCITCNMTCHKDCKIRDDEKKYNCWAMDQVGFSSKCRICPQKCIWSEHQNRPYLIRYETVTETRTADDLKRKYHRAVEGKATSEEMMKSLDKDLEEVHVDVLTKIKRAQQSLRRLDEIALKPNPLTQLEYLELLMESEKREAKPGWKRRIKYLEIAKSQAEILSKVQDEEEIQKVLQQFSRGDSTVSKSVQALVPSGEKWYSRFKFWQKQR